MVQFELVIEINESPAIALSFLKAFEFDILEQGVNCPVIHVLV
jgi:hypothetical protein